MSDYTDQDIFRKVSTLLENIDQNQQLQQAAYENGIDVKNSTRLTAATKDNLAVSVIALLLAKRNNDPRCKDLVDFGLKHRTTKVDIINDYKNEANALITRYRNGERPEPEVQITINTEAYLDEDIPNIYDEYAFINWSDRVIQESIGKVIGTIVLLPFVIIAKAIALVISLIDRFIGLFTRISPQKLLKKLEEIPAEKRKSFSLIVKADNKDDMKLLRMQSDGFLIITEAFASFCDIAEAVIESGGNEAKLVNAVNELAKKCEKLMSDTSIKAPSMGENEGVLTYDETVDLLKDLCRFDMRKCRDVNFRLQRILGKIKTVSQKEKDKNGGLTDADVGKLQIGVAMVTSKIQSWTKMRDRILKRADIMFNGYASSQHDANDKRKKELEKSAKETKSSKLFAGNNPGRAEREAAHARAVAEERERERAAREAEERRIREEEERKAAAAATTGSGSSLSPEFSKAIDDFSEKRRSGQITDRMLRDDPWSDPTHEVYF